MSGSASAPLAGLRVVVTRPRHQAAGLAAAFAAAGARVEELPLLEVVPPADPGPLARAATAVAGFDWIAFTSANAVDALLAALGGPPPAATAVAAVGGATARALRRRGVAPRLVAAGGSGGALARELAAAAGGVAGRSVLLPLAADARPELAAGLAAAGARVTAVVAYDKRPPAGAAAEVARLFPPATPLGWVTFTSPRLARTFAELLDRAAGPWPDRRSTLLAASIGPTTSAELRRLGAPPAAEAPNPGDAELVAAVARAVGDTIPGP